MGFHVDQSLSGSIGNRHTANGMLTRQVKNEEWRRLSVHEHQEISIRIKLDIRILSYL